jgi:hypothetical protein
VLDEKMKEAVKITVIATGFKESGLRRSRLRETYDPVIIPREVSRHQRDQFLDQDPDPVFEPEPAFEPDPVPAVFQPSDSGNAHAAEMMQADAMRTPSYQAEDLDVPAFLR